MLGTFTGKVQHPDQPPENALVNPSQPQLLSPGDASTQGISRPSSRIITLPDGEEYYDRIAQGDSDSDYGEVSGETDTPEDNSGNSTPDPEAGADGAGTVGSRTKRHSTYFHHPERRRSVIPGAFPG
ncbi:13807_t:CDS:2, partial [Acaulospora colombiana]